MSRSLRSLALAAPLALAALSASPSAEAFCGFYVSGADTKLYNNATQVVLLRDNARTVLSMQNNYQGPPEGFAMVVPVPVVLHKDNVKTLSKAVFDHIDQLTAPRLVEYWEQDPCEVQRERMRFGAKYESASVAMAPSPQGAAPMPAVRIEAQFEVGEYDIVILSADDSSALDSWLRDNHYRIPEGAEPVLRPYVAQGSKFFVAKVDPEKVKFENGMATLSPLRFHYDDDAFRLPVRLGLLNSNGTQDLIVNIIARKDRYEAANYANLTIPTNIELNEEALGAFGAFYLALFEKTVEKQPNTVVTEYSWNAGSCDPCPGPTLQQVDLDALGADTLVQKTDDPKPGSPPPAPGMQPWDATVTRLHVRYTKDSLGEDLVFRKAAPIEGGNGWQSGPEKHASRVIDSQYGTNTFQGRYIVRHPWKGEITCADPQFERWGAMPGKVGAVKDVAFAPKGGITLSTLVAEEVKSIGVSGSRPKIERKYNVSPLLFLRTARFALGLGLIAGIALVYVVRQRLRRST